MTRLQISVFLTVGSILVGAAWLDAGPTSGPASAPRPTVRMDKALSGEFFKLCGSLASEASKRGAMTVRGRDGWLFLGSELRHLSVGEFWGDSAVKASRATRPDLADPLEAIVDYKAQLDKLGIELIVMPIPPKAVIYPEKLSSSFVGAITPGPGGLPTRLDYRHAEFYALLGQKGIDVLDLTDTFLAIRAGGPAGGKGQAPELYCRTDSHFSPYACQVAAGVLARRISSRAWLGKARKLGPIVKKRSRIEITGNLTVGLDPKVGPELVAIQTVLEAGGLGRPIEADLDSPLVLMGDSHCLVFSVGGDMHCRGAGLADHIAGELGVAVDVLGVRGSGARPARVNLYRRARADKSYLGAKRLIVWCFSAREWTEASGWGKLPVTR